MIEKLPLPIEVDASNSAQNAFVQEWLYAWANVHVPEGDKDWDTVECMVEAIQETYSYVDHEQR